MRKSCRHPVDKTPFSAIWSKQFHYEEADLFPDVSNVTPVEEKSNTSPSYQNPSNTSQQHFTQTVMSDTSQSLALESLPQTSSSYLPTADAKDAFYQQVVPPQLDAVQSCAKYSEPFGQLVMKCEPPEKLVDVNLNTNDTMDDQVHVAEDFLQMDLHWPQSVNHFPATNNYEGDYGFRISFGEHTENAPKSVHYTYSVQLNKIFAQMLEIVPVEYRCTFPPPENCRIKALLVYKKSADISKLVTKCSNHRASDVNGENPNHLVLANMPHLSDVQYGLTTEGREYVSMPYEPPQIGMMTSVLHFKFTCLSSCKDGINRRPLVLKFHLESPTGDVLGRQVVDLCICTCPGRDRTKEETKLFKKRSEETKKLKRPNPAAISGSQPKQSNPGSETYTFTWKTEHREVYDKLQDYAQSIEMVARLSPATKECLIADMKRDEERQ
ncbi:cellular tumor antigen p53-like [Clavelina lepadiformis]|uniref:cellular tumor antigen p53-like n=1 Tax=Clavelina lepadiformis TaxID=159417 RepID=UPI004043944E